MQLFLWILWISSILTFQIIDLFIDNINLQDPLLRWASMRRNRNSLFRRHSRTAAGIAIATKVEPLSIYQSISLSIYIYVLKYLILFVSFPLLFLPFSSSSPLLMIFVNFLYRNTWGETKERRSSSQSREGAGRNGHQRDATNTFGYEGSEKQ